MTDRSSQKSKAATSASQDKQDANPGRIASRPCPVCQKLSDPQYRPFCSRHCADVDLARWLGGRYAIPARPSADDEQD